MINVRERNGHWQYDIVFRWPDGTPFRERKRAPVTSKSGAQRYAQDRERFLLTQGKQAESNGDVPTLKEFWPRVLDEHYRALRRKTSTIESAETAYKHLAILHDKTLDHITNADVSRVKANLASGSPKTANNVLSVLGVTLDCAVDWEVLPAMPCKIKLLPVASKEMSFYEVSVYRKMVKAAAKLGPLYESLILLAGSAGLRAGEIRALKWGDIDLARKIITVSRAIVRGVEDTPKGNRSRQVYMTEELVAALKAFGPAHKKDRVFLNDECEDFSEATLRTRFGAIEQAAGFERTENIHVFRHSFCSHLAMAGVPARTVQELAGHADLKTTLKYMHLSPENKSDAIKTLGAFYTLQGAV